jgi:hypothetical protein
VELGLAAEMEKGEKRFCRWGRILFIADDEGGSGGVGHWPSWPPAVSGLGRDGGRAKRHQVPAQGRAQGDC